MKPDTREFTCLLEYCLCVCDALIASMFYREVSEGHWQQDVSSNARRRLLRCLPAGVLHEMSRRLGLSLPESHLQMSDTREEVLDRVVSMGKPAELVAQSLRAIVWRSSM